LTEEELSCLRAHAPNFLKALWPPLLSGAFFLLLLSIPILLLGKYWSATRPYQPFLFLAAALFLLPQMLRFYKDELSRSRDLRDDIDRGEAEVRQYTAVEAIRVEEAEDEGTGFFLRLSDGNILFLCGQQFYELEDQQNFPSDRFEYAVAPASRWPLGFEATGEYLPVSYLRSAFALKDIERGLTPCDGDIFAGEFDALKTEDWPLAPGTLKQVN
jgi:hypothetical protein